jgi:hypothetical protein
MLPDSEFPPPNKYGGGDLESMTEENPSLKLVSNLTNHHDMGLILVGARMNQL